MPVFNAGIHVVFIALTYVCHLPRFYRVVPVAQWANICYDATRSNLIPAGAKISVIFLLLLRLQFLL